MAQYLPLPDGSSVTVREGESPQQAWARAQQMYPEAFQTRQPQAKPETTFGGQAKEFVKGILPGGIGALESAAIGASALLPEDYEKQARAGITRLAGAAKKPFEAAPGYEDTVARKLGEAGGSIIPFLAMGPLGAAGRVGMAGLGMGMGAGEARTRAEKEGATADQRALATGFGSVVGLSELLAPARILGRVGEPITQGIVAQLKRIGLAGGEEALQEAASQAAQNLIAKGIYKPEQEIIEQVGESAAYGGAVGAMAQGLMDMALGRRAKGTAGTPDEIRQAREAAAAQRAELEQKRQDPAYAQDIQAQYDALEEQKNELKAQIVKGKKGQPLSSLDAANNKRVGKQLNELDKKLKPLTDELVRVRPLLLKAQQTRDAETEARYAQMEAEVGGGTEAQAAPYYETPQGELPGFGGAVLRPAPTAAPDTTDYATQIRNLEGRLDELRTQAQTTPDLAQKQEINRQYQQVQKAIVDAQKLAQAQKQAAVTPDTKIAALRKRMAAAEESGDVPAQAAIAQQLLDLGVTDMAPEPTQLGFPLTTHKPVSEGKAEFAARVYKPGAPELETQEQEYLAEQERQRQQTAEDAARERRLLPETSALKRIAERPAVRVGETQVSGLVDQLVNNYMQRAGATPTGQVVSGAGTERVSRADSLRAQLAYANATDNRPRAKDIKDMLAQMEEPETERAAGDLELGEAAKQAGVEGRQATGVMEANRITRLAQNQLTAFDRLADYVQSVRESDQNVAESRKQTLRSAAERMKDITAGLALNEMDARRAQAGMAPLSTEEKTKAVGRMNAILNELITRGAGLFNVVETPAVTRGTLTLQSAKEGPPPVGQRMFGNLGMAANSLRGQLRQVMDETVGVKAPAPRAPVVPRRVDEGLRVQFAGQERPIAQQFEAAKARATDEQRTALDELETKFGNLTPEAQELALEQARNVELGKEMTVPGQLQQELADLRRARESETGQAELFPGASEKGVTRSTSNRFMRYLDSGEVYRFKQALAEQARMAEFQAKRANTIQQKLDEEIAQQQAMMAKLAGPWFENPTSAARKAFEKVVDKNKAATDLAAKINKQRVGERQRVGDKVAQLLNTVNEAKKHLREIKDVHDIYAKRYLTTPMVAKYKQGFETVTQQLEAAEKSVAEAQKSLDKGQAAQKRVLERQAGDTINNAILREGQKAEGAIERARLAVVKAQAEEGAAAARLRSSKAELPTRAAPKEATTYDTVRVFRDTSDANVQSLVAAQKKNVGKWENAYEAAQLAGNKQGMEIAVRNIENAYSKIYEILNNAPLRRQAVMTVEQELAQEAFDRSQYQTVEALTKLVEEQTGAKLRMTKRKIEGVTKSLRTGAVRSEIKAPSLAQQEAQFKKEQETGEYAAKTLEQIAEARAARQKAQDQIDYIDTHKAEPRSEAAARQKVARTKAVAERNRLDAVLKALQSQQKTVEQEARIEKKATKELRREKQAMLRKPGRLQEALETDEGFAAPVREEGGTPISPETYRQLLDGSIVNAVNDIAENSEVPLLKETASKVKDFILRTKFEFVPEITHEGERVAALYSPANNTVYMTPEGRTQEDLIHEVTHAATMRALTMPDESLTTEQRKAKQELSDMYDTMSADSRFKDAYAIKNLKEFVSEVQSNQGLRDMMDQEPGLLRRFYNAVLRFLGVNRVDLSSADAQAAIEKLYMQSRVIEEAAPVAAGRAKYATPEWEAASKTVDRFVAKNKSWIDRIKANTSGLAFETQVVDRFAGFERLAKYMEPLKGSQMMFYLRMYDQRMNMVSQAVEQGAPERVEKTRADGSKEYVLEAKAGPSIKRTVEILKDAKPMIGNGDAVNRAFTLYMAAIRADNKGIESLNFGEDVTPEMLNEVRGLVDSNPELKQIFNDAREEYNDYNRNLIKFVVDSGALSEETGKALTEENDYIPFYRERNGVAELVIGNEAPIRIGSIAEQPYLHELVGGDKPILDFMTSSVQNTNMLIDMGMRNLATKNAVFELVDLGAAKLVKKAEGPDAVKFKVDGENKYAVLATDRVQIGNQVFDTGVPADILVKGMEGIPTQMPAILRAMAFPSKLLRKGVTLSPLYMARQLFRDSLAAPIMSGADFTPILGALKTIGSPTKEVLERRGIVGGQQFTGTSEDVTKILRDVADGKPGWMQALGKFESMAMEADALTRRAQYDSYIKQGMSEMEATLLALESMNFNKRGASPSIHIANSLIPFFNAQIQGLNVLYKALSGKMPFNDKLRIREKLLQRGGMMATAAVVYALMMQDDEAYQNATPDQKYGNWFVRLPGVDEPMRLPVPFEIGYIFKAIPEALVNTMLTEHGGEEAVKAFGQIIKQTIPGGSSYGIPQALKPAIEAGLGKSFYTGRDILSEREKNLAPEEQFRANTTEMAKLVGREAGISPIVFENLVRGYTGTAGLAFLQALSLGVPKGESPEQATRRLSEYPIVGGAWQPNDAGGIINSVYERMNDAKKVGDTYEKMLAEGRMKEAEAFVNRNGDAFMQSTLADVFSSNIGELTKAERAIQASAMTPDEKRKQLDDIRKLKIALAKTAREVADKTTRLISPL